MWIHQLKMTATCFPAGTMFGSECTFVNSYFCVCFVETCLFLYRHSCNVSVTPKGQYPSEKQAHSCHVFYHKSNKTKEESTVLNTISALPPVQSRNTRGERVTGTVSKSSHIYRRKYEKDHSKTSHMYEKWKDKNHIARFLSNKDCTPTS